MATNPTHSITTAARRLTREHNSPAVESGWIYLVNLETGEIGGLVATYAATQIAEGHELYGRFALLRVEHSKLSHKRAQEFLDCKGKGW